MPPLELSIGGVYLPSTLILALLVVGVLWAVEGLLVRMGMHARTWHPALLRIALYSCAISLIGLFLFEK